MRIRKRDRAILRQLAEEKAEIAALPVHAETAAEWRRLNGLQIGRPLVWINEIPWHEMDVDGELELRAEDPFCRQVEWTLRTELYQWRHMRGDMVVEPTFYSPLVIHDTGFGIREEVDVILQDERGGIVSREFHPQIDREADLKKIQMPIVTHDEEASERNLQRRIELFGDLLTVKPRGIVHQWFAPWDELVRWWDVQKVLLDLAVRPQLVHAAVERLMSAYLCRLEQWEALNLLSLTEGNYRVGSGGLGYCDEIPPPGFDPEHVHTQDQWGCATAQIFSEVSPAMHEEFALQYERRWLERFRLTYYGCCEPLHDKIELLKSIPNLRKISMSPWADVERMATEAGDRYVLSHKPNPAVFATDHWDLDGARRNLEEVLVRTRGCVVEVIMKDISTVRDEPQRLWEWAQMATELTAQFA